MENSAPLTKVLASHLAQIEIGSVSEAARRLAVAAIIDTLGVTLGGSVEPTAALLRANLDEPAAGAACLVVGIGQRLGMLDAALANGTAAHALDFDDMAAAMGGHPSVPVVPAVFALGEAIHASGERVVEAFLVGFEAECRLGRVVQPHHYTPGWHPTSTLGVFGAAAAASRLMKLDIDRTATALSIAASMASGLKANFGTMVKPLHAGNAARGGLLAARLAQGGYSANPAVLEHRQGFFSAYDGLDNVHPDRMLDHWGERLEIEQDDVGLKQFPCCGSTHSSARAMIGLVQRVAIDARDVESIEIRTHPDRLPHTNNPAPASALAAKFSIQYAVVRALLDGTLRLRHFEEGAFAEPAAQKLLERVRLSPYGEDGAPVDAMAAEVNVTLSDGNVLSQRVSGGLGRGGSNPMTEREMWQKFSDCAQAVLSEPEAARAFDAVSTMERVEDVNIVTRTLASAR